MRPLIITSGGAPANVIRTYKEEIRRISNCILLDTTISQVKELGPIEKNMPGYFIMNQGLDDSLFYKHTGIDIGCSVVYGEGDGERAEGKQGINRQKEDFILAFAMDEKLGISERIWSNIERHRLTVGTDYVLFIAGLGGGTGSGSINSIASRYYKARDVQERTIRGSKHLVLGILPSIRENDQGEDVNRLRFNTVWALYDMLRPIKRPNPLILLDNEAMDSENVRSVRPIMNIISILSDWRPDKDGGDFFTKYGTKTMAPYYASIEKSNIHKIDREDIDRALANLVVGEGKINATGETSGRWYLTIGQEDVRCMKDNAINGRSAEDRSSVYIVTKGLTIGMRSYLRERISRLLCIEESRIGSVVMEWPLLDRPGKAEFMLLLFFQSPLELSRIRDCLLYTSPSPRD